MADGKHLAQESRFTAIRRKSGDTGDWCRAASPDRSRGSLASTPQSLMC